METAEYFRKAIWDYLEGKPRGAQTRLAEGSGINRVHLNDFLAGRRAMKESFRLKITNYLGVDYLDFLQHGKKLLESDTQVKETSAPPGQIISLEDKHLDVTKKFKKKARAIRINEKLVYAEQLDEDSLDKIEDQIDLELKDLEKRAGIKKRPAANGNG